ncbi:MAG TPA: ABC transporter substrate-binding protein [Paracoccaceae bacterium]|nr:ABC transporter substrate-binding protein [Paracoccaceae bacterium]
MDHRTGISRRHFIASTAALGLFAATAPAFAQSAPKRDGTLATGIEGASTGDTLDPRTFNSPYWAVAAGTIFNTLVEVQGSANELKPGLAKSWEGSNGGKTWVFELADNATFHDGKPVTTADVIYSLQIHNAEDSLANIRAVAALPRTPGSSRNARQVRRIARSKTSCATCSPMPTT